MAGSYGSTDDKSMDLLHESIRVNEESQLVGAAHALRRAPARCRRIAGSGCEALRLAHTGTATMGQLKDQREQLERARDQVSPPPRAFETASKARGLLSSSRRRRANARTKFSPRLLATTGRRDGRSCEGGAVRDESDRGQHLPRKSWPVVYDRGGIHDRRAARVSIRNEQGQALQVAAGHRPVRLA